MDKANTLGRLSDVLFDELDRLMAVDVSDKDALQSEVVRSQAVESTAKTIVKNANTILAATRMRADLAVGETHMPRMLEG